MNNYLKTNLLRQEIINTQIIRNKTQNRSLNAYFFVENASP